MLVSFNPHGYVLLILKAVTINKSLNYFALKIWISNSTFLMEIILYYCHLNHSLYYSLKYLFENKCL